MNLCFRNRVAENLTSSRLKLVSFLYLTEPGTYGKEDKEGSLSRSRPTGSSHSPSQITYLFTPELLCLLMRGPILL
jgi:hypothetical protein